MISYAENVSKEVSEFLYSKMRDVFFCGLDMDGNRTYAIKIGFSQRMPMRQRYDRYIGMLGMVEDIKGSLTQSWCQYTQFREERQQNQKLEKMQNSGLAIQPSLEDNIEPDQGEGEDDGIVS